MNPATPIDSPRIQLNEKNADRLGVAASVLCAIHCALAPVLLIFLPTFGKIWAHPASHALVAIFIVPLAAFSIMKGYKKHGKRWIPASALVGIFFVLFGAALPAFTKAEIPAASPDNEPTPEATVAGDGECDDESCEGCADASCDDASCEEGCEDCEVEPGDDAVARVASGSSSEDGTSATCVDGCCPSLQVSETGETTLHVPPAAIITTLGGIFLIAAHIGNLRSGAGSCLISGCQTCES